MSDVQSIRHLLLALNNSSINKSAITESQALNNIVYFLPRITDPEILAQLIHALFHWTPQHLTIWEGFEAASAIMKWKLEISEPRLRIDKFVLAWKQEIELCSVLNLYQLATVAGLISCRHQLDNLQEHLFIDDSGTASEELKDIRFRHFMPYWKQYMSLSRDDYQLVDDLCTLYSMVHSQSDHGIPHELVFQSLFNILIEYIRTDNRQDVGPNSFAHKHLNLICKACEHSIAHVRDHNLLMNKLNELKQTMEDLSEKEALSGEKDYTEKYYVNTLFAVVLVLCGYQPTNTSVRAMALTLFHSSFILHDFGTDGFTKYRELIFSVCSFTCKEFVLFDQILKEMLTKMQFVMQNKVYHSKMIFVMEFLQLNLAELKIPNAQYLEKCIEPLIGPFLDSADVSLRESAQLSWLEMFNNESWNTDVRNFKLKRLRCYLSDCFQQYKDGLMTEEQLVLIWKTLSPTIKYLSNFDHDLIRDLIHMTYRRMINTENLEMKSVSIYCLIEQLYNVTDDYLWHWLDTCYEFLNGVPPTMKEAVITKLWEYTSHSHNEVAIRWWYDRVVPNLSRI
ncbi:unnamed protein product [Kluyveromyces dobzhanskii CBS 2104]|uniref:WGS project CCBQ000000000 data, contig MAT n=1 Tax=Kluyveromyces dobzhanskii CBS 2104 TaxID=1427455 RepID=A0A0A8L411_9SACH|nr:unnamed protein product [Kluyveromyces dobzhanskii CBS 2104]